LKGIFSIYIVYRCHTYQVQLINEKSISLGVDATAQK
jgi:hypothetical protein